MATFEERLAAAREKKRLEAEGQSAPTGGTFEEKLAAARAQKGGTPRLNAQQPQGEKRDLGEFLGGAAMDFARTGSDVVAGVNQAAVDLLGMPKMGYNALVQSLGLGDLTVEAGAKDIPLIGDFIDRATRRQVEDPNAVQDMLRTGAEWGAGGLVTKGSKVPDIASGVGAAIGEQIGGDTGEMVGGIAGLFSGRPAELFSAGARNAKPKGIDETTRAFILANAHNPERAIANIESAIANGEVGNLAELSRDQGIFNVVDKATVQGSEFASDLNTLAQARNQQIIDESAGVFGAGDATEAERLAAQRQTELQTGARQRTNAQLEQETQQLQADPQFQPTLPQATQRLNVAREAERAAREQVTSDMKPSQASTRFADTYSAEEAAFKQDFVDPQWEKFSEGADINGAEFKKIAERELANINKTDADILEQKFGGQLRLIRNLGDDIQPDQIHSVISQMKAINRNARVNNDYTPANRLLDQTINAMEAGLRELGDKGAYDEAVRLTTEQFKRFQPTRVGEARGVREDATLGARLLDRNEGGFEVGRLINNSGSPAIRAEAQEYIRSIATRDGIDENFMRNYDELLDAFPQLKGDLQRAKQAQDELAGAATGVSDAMKADAKSATALTKAVEKAQTKAGTRRAGLNKTISNLELSNFRDNPAKFLDAAIKGGSDTLSKLSRQLGRVEGGTDALRSAVRDRFVANLTDKGGTVTANKVAEFNANKRNLINAGILSRDEVMQIEDVLERVNVSGLAKTAGLRKTAEADDIIADVLSSGAAIAALQVLPASNQLMLGGAVRRVTRRLLGGKQSGATASQAKVLAALDRMILNPEEFLRGVKDRKVVTEQQLEDYMISYINAVSQSVSEDAPNE